MHEDPVIACVEVCLTLRVLHNMLILVLVTVILSSVLPLAQNAALYSENVNIGADERALIFWADLISSTG